MPDPEYPNVITYSYCGSLEFQDFAGIGPNMSELAVVTTWENELDIGYAGSGVVAQAIQNATDKAVNQFINEYLAANPVTK
ncbi:MAG: hypothetical protein ACLQVD_18110 [Capsulimonadaceae bacterium]